MISEYYYLIMNKKSKTSECLEKVNKEQEIDFTN